MIKKFIQFTNGKKTLAGAALHFAVVVLGAAGTSFGFAPFSASELAQIDGVATFLMGAGFLHKGVKAVQ